MTNSHFVLMLLAACVLGCARTQKATVTYPYRASSQRESQIIGGAPQVLVGMKPAQVTNIMGDPDEVMDLFRRSDIEQKPVGYTYWYMVKRKAAPQT